eukprot:3302632-Amphidinium_carterae.1
MEQGSCPNVRLGHAVHSQQPLQACQKVLLHLGFCPQLLTECANVSSKTIASQGPGTEHHANMHQV